MTLFWVVVFVILSQAYCIEPTPDDPSTEPTVAHEDHWDQLLRQILANQLRQSQQLQTIQQRLIRVENGFTGKLANIQHDLQQLKETMGEVEWGGGVEGAVEALRTDLNALRQTWEYRQAADVNHREDRIPEVVNKVNQLGLVLRRVSGQVKDLGQSLTSDIKALADNTSMLITAQRNHEPPSCPLIPAAPIPIVGNGSQPLDCWDVLRRGQNQSGVYQIQPSRYHNPFMVVCDMHTMGGGWTVFQSREDGSTQFLRPWREFETGFGNMAAREFWLGLEKLHLITNARVNDLLVTLSDNSGDSAWAYYEQFTVGSSDQEYAITSLGNYHGTAGDSLRGHVHKFSTEDRDNDLLESISCARSGAWWYQDCEDQDVPISNLNGLYLNGSLPQVFPSQGMLWTSWRGLSYSIPHTAMMVRPSADVYKQSTTPPPTTTTSYDFSIINTERVL